MITVKTFKTTALVLLFGLSIAALGQNNEPIRTINIDFKDLTQEGMEFNVSLPITFLETFKPQIQEALENIKYGEDQIDFGAIWRAVRDSGPTEFVEINDVSTDVKVSTTSTHLLVKVDDKSEGHLIDVKVPLALGDALFTNFDNIDYDSIVDALLQLQGEDLVVITGDKINGRVWIE